MALNQADDDDELDRLRRFQDFTTIDWIQDAAIERNRRLRQERKARAAARHARTSTVRTLLAQLAAIARAGQSWFIVALVGVCIGANSALISLVTEWLSDLKMGYCADGWWLNQGFCCWEIDGDDADGCASWQPWSTYTLGRWAVYVFFAGTLAFIAAHLVKMLARYAAGSGISEIKCILAGFVMRGFLGVSTLAIKSITLPLVIASGLSVGKEGPSVHMACCIGSVVAGLFPRFARSQGKMREILTASSAAGVAVAFGAPVGGVLFSIEEMSGTLRARTLGRAFACALAATVTLAAINPFRTGKLVLFQVTYDRDWHFFEIIFFIVLGIFGGLYGAFVVSAALHIAAFRRRYLAGHAVLEATALALLTALLGYGNRFLRGDMTEGMAVLFRECEAGGDYDHICQTSVQWRMVNSLLLATIIRGALVVVSTGCRVPAGIFVPSMAVGAAFGRMLGIVVNAAYRAYPASGVFAYCKPDVPCITPGTYAFLGAAAALSGVMRITVTVVVIMFELTGALTYILPTMIVLLVTKAVGDLLGVRGIADEMIRFNGYPFLEHDDHALDVPVAAVMRKDLTVLHATGMTVADVEGRLASAPYKGFPVVAADGTNLLLGYIERTELRWVIDKARKVRDVPRTTPCTFVAPASGAHAHGDFADGELADSELEDGLLTPDVDGSFLSDGPAPAIGMSERVATRLLEGGADALALWPWVNTAPLTVGPRLPLEVAMQLFKRMGPRVILVEERGRLVGLVTVKDVLRFTERAEEDAAASGEAAGTDAVSDALEEGWTWAGGRAASALEWARRRVGR